MNIVLEWLRQTAVMTHSEVWLVFCLGFVVGLLWAAQMLNREK